jgi:hypothetical protein
MGVHPVQKIRCPICRKPIDLTVDLCADENGQPVHEDCYARRITVSRILSLSSLSRRAS